MAWLAKRLHFVNIKFVALRRFGIKSPFIGDFCDG